MTANRYPKAGTPLTERERETLVLVGKGCTDKEVARLLSMTAGGVNDRLKRIYRKLDVNSRVEAAVWACKQGWL